MQQAGRAAPLQHRCQLPAQVKGVLHGDVHALPGFRAVGVAGIAGDEDARQAGVYLPGLEVVKAVAQALADFIDGPPGHFFHVKHVGVEDALGSGDQLFKRDVASCHALVHREFVELYVEANQITALARNNHDAALIGRLD